MTEEMENDEIYVYGHQEYVLNEVDLNSEIGNLICQDGSRAFLVDGQYYITDGQAVLLHDGDSRDLTQFYIDDNRDSDDAQAYDDSTNAAELEGTTSAEIVHLIPDGTTISDDEQSVIYLTDADFIDQDQDGVINTNDHVYPSKRIQLEGQMLDFEDFIQQPESADEMSTIDINDSCHGDEDDDDDVQYELIDGSEFLADVLHRDGDVDENCDVTDSINLSKITGRNLITGQIVTLHSYMAKLKKKLNSNHLDKLSNRSNGLSTVQSQYHDLLDKKICIGKTKSGKKLIGKIIHVGHKDNVTSDSSSVNQDGGENDDDDVNVVPCDDDDDDDSAVCRQEVVTNNRNPSEDVTMESFEEVSKTLSGVMDMETVRKKLENRNLTVKLIIKMFADENDSYIKTTSYWYGYMEHRQMAGDEGGACWVFVQQDQDGDKRFHLTTTLTISIGHDRKGAKTIRVNLNSYSGGDGEVCTICGRAFKSNVNLKTHIEHAHNSAGTVCAICGQDLKSRKALQQHKQIHVAEGRIFPCCQCDKVFSTRHRLEKHLPVHDLYLRPLQCSVCDTRCSSEWVLKKHLLTHTGIKPYACDVCNRQFLNQYDLNSHRKIHFPEKHFVCEICLRTFSRHSNLLRHMVIHRGNGALYKCAICSCSYNYVSSLTRHMVQNHIDVRDFRHRIDKI